MRSSTHDDLAAAHNAGDATQSGRGWTEDECSIGLELRTVRRTDPAGVVAYHRHPLVWATQTEGQIAGWACSSETDRNSLDLTYAHGTPHLTQFGHRTHSNS